MKFYKIKYIFPVLLIVFFVGSCSDSILDEIDTNPNSPTDVSLNLILPAVQTHLAYAVIGGDMSLYASVWVQHTTGVHAQLHDADRFTYTNSLVNNTWNSIYLNTLRNTDIIIEKAEQQDLLAYRGIAKIIKAYTIGITTDTWGRVPYSEALQGTANRTPVFDTQESIYNDPEIGIFALLDQAIADLSAGGVGPSSDDLIFGGDLEKWRRTAHSLKAKFMTRLKNTTYYDANVVINAAQSETGFASPSDAFIFNSFTNDPTGEHPWRQEFRDRTHFAVSESLFDRMTGVDDPRVELFFDDGAASIPAPNGAGELDQAGNIYTKIYDYIQSTSPIEFMTYDELQFALAEAYLSQGNSEAAYDAYLAGLEAAVLRTGVSAEDAEAFMMTSSVAPGAGSLTNELIWEQKYISFYPFQSIEAFAEYRRTNYPNLINPNGEIPRRMPYPQGEIDSNGANVPNVQLYPGPGVWWDNGTED